jgi:hypothetical protein
MRLRMRVNAFRPARLNDNTSNRQRRVRTKISLSNISPFFPSPSVHDDRSMHNISSSSPCPKRFQRMAFRACQSSAPALGSRSSLLARSCTIRLGNSPTQLEIYQTYRHSKRFKVQRSSPNLPTLDDLRPDLDATILLRCRAFRGDRVSSRMMP